MSDNLFALLQQARQVATTGDARMFGVEVGLVTNVKDPEKLGRVKVCLPRLPGKPESDWMRVTQPAAGPGRGFYWVPQVNDEVLIAYERGEARLPFVLGCLWNGKDTPMQGAYADENSTHKIQTKSGHQIVLDDKKDAEKIVIADKSGKRTLTFDVKNKKFKVDAGEGDVEIKAAKKIVLQCEDLEVKTGQKGKVKIGSSLQVKIADKAQIQAGSKMDLKASKIELNPGSLSVEALAAAAMQAVQAALAPAPAAAPPPAANPPPPGGGGDLASSEAPTGGGAGGGTAGGAVGGTSAGAEAKGGSGAGGGGAEPAGNGAQPQAGPAAGPAAAQQPAPAPAGAESTTPADQIDIQLVNSNGTPQKNVQVELALPDGEKRGGKTDDQGHFKLEGLVTKGNAKLDVPDVQVAPAAPASSPDRVRFVKGGVDVAIGKSTVVELPPRVRRCRMRGMHFDTAKTFLLPSAMIGIRQLVKLYKSFEGIVGLVNGHTDKQGDAAYNRGLSNERAEALKAFLTDDANTWMKWYGTMPNSKSWGIREDQLMLSSVKDGSAPFYGGPIDGKAASAKDAYKSFQHSRVLPESGAPDSNTRLELVRAYMAQDGTSLDKGAKLSTHGCGMTHPLPETKDDPNPDQPANRRVEIFLFEEKIDPAPRSPCPSAGCPDYDKWVEQKILDVDLDQPPGALRVKVVDESGNPIDGAQVHASGPLVLDEVTKDGGTALFTDIVPGSYRVTAEKDTVAADDAIVEVPSGPADSPPGTGAAEAKLAIKGPLAVHLTLGWMDPDGKEHAFPADTPVKIAFGDGSKSDLKVEADGALKFPAERTKKSFSIELELKDDKQYLAVAPASDAATKDSMVDEGALKPLLDKGFRVFRLPKSLTQARADWSADGTLRKAFENLGDKATVIGTASKPVKLTLDPKWQFLRLEYFDRFFGHTDHAHKRVSVPPLMLDGWRTDPGGSGKKDNPDTRSNWVAAAGDLEKASHCIPWILQRDAAGKDDPKPDPKILLQFTTDPGSFVVSTSKDERKLGVVTDKAKLAPSAERLKLYDLPPLWKSTKWFARQGAAGAFFDKLTAAQMKDSLTAAKRLTFSLDDIVLCDPNRKQVALAATDRVAVFFHRFVTSADAGKTSAAGVYKPDDANQKSFVSEAAVATKGYISDYPNWTRLVMAQGNLFEAFAERTADDPANEVVGARAAVRWVDSIAVGTAAGNTLSPRPARTDKDFFSIQPFFEQLYNQTNLKYTGPNTTTQTIGRVDLALLRCCDRDGDNEVGIVLHYFRMLFNFMPNAPAGTAASPFHPPAANFQQKRDTYMDACCRNMAARFNGNDAISLSRGELVPKKATDKLKAQVVYFVQPVANAASAHFNLQVVRPGAGALGGRAWMQGLNGTGELGENSQAPESSFSPGSYIAAHELGHGDSLPDEYNERWGSFSNLELSFQMNTPGDPFETDGANWDPAQVTTPDSGLMNGVQTMRNRYFWHSAEFARTVSSIPLLVKLGNNYQKFEVPPHETVAPETATTVPRRSYVYWPIQDKVDDTAGGRSQYDLLLYAMGEDRFTKHLIPNGPFEGTLVVVVKLHFTFDATFFPSVAAILPALRNRVRADHGSKFFAEGKVRVGSPQEWEFKKCLIRFSPRFIVSNGNTANPAFNGLVSNVGPHFRINVNNAKPANTRWSAAAPDRNLILEADATSPNAQNALQNAFSDRFAEMLGFLNAAAVTAASLKPYVQKVISTAADVKTF
ncbi:MAG TPA: phage baseplate assembly protein V [Myxococcales bacterium]|nr:phage baseplate assembly protein V [Myxococcales bacterium]